jgi:hypothetical protein
VTLYLLEQKKFYAFAFAIEKKIELGHNIKQSTRNKRKGMTVEEGSEI